VVKYSPKYLVDMTSFGSSHKDALDNDYWI